MGSDNNTKALKSGVWYTVANFFMKSIGFITTPLFTRLLTKSDYGLYNNYASWLSTFLVIVTLNLGASFISAKFDHEKDFDGYVSSTLVLSTLATALGVIIVNAFPAFFTKVTGIEHRYLNIMFLYLMFYAAVDMFQTRERFFFEYKISVLTSLSIGISTAAVSVLLVVHMDNKLCGRIVGSAAPTVLAGILLYSILLWRGKKVNVTYWRYALPICVPFIPHLLSLSLLNAMDKMMITKICGPEDNALYSVAYNCGAVITLLVVSLNTAFSPWLGERLHEKKYDEIRAVSRTYVLFFVYASCGVMMITPELLLVMGGKSYSGALYVMPPVTFGCVCQFLYTMYVNVEQFNKRTVGMAVASVVAAASNYLMNWLLIPRVGFEVAAYTTLASFMILLFIHMFLVRRMGLSTVYSTKLVICVLLFMSGFTALVHLLFRTTVLRYSVLGVYAVITVVIALKNKTKLLTLFKKKS